MSIDNKKEWNNLLAISDFQSPIRGRRILGKVFILLVALVMSNSSYKFSYADTVSAKPDIEDMQNSNVSKNVQIEQDVARFKNYLKIKSNLYLKANAIVGLGGLDVPVAEIHSYVGRFTSHENELISALAKKVLAEAETKSLQKQGDLKKTGQDEAKTIPPERERQINNLIQRLKSDRKTTKKAVLELIAMGEHVIDPVIEFIRAEHVRNYQGSANAALDVLLGLKTIPKEYLLELVTISAQDPLEDSATVISYGFYNKLNRTICDLENESNESIDARLIMLNHPRQATRIIAVMSIGKVETSSRHYKEVLDGLSDRLTDIDGKVIAAAAIQIGNYGHAAQNINVLVKLIVKAQQPFKPSPNYHAQPYELMIGEYQELGVQGYAARALGEIGVVLPQVIAALEKAVQSENPHVSKEAMNALSKLSLIDPNSPEQIEILGKMLNELRER